MPLKVLMVFGTRPEAIKLAPVFHELQQRSESADIRTTVCVAAQHRQMLDQALHLFGIQPDYDLDVMKHDQSPSQVAAAVLNQLEPILRQERPEWVLVQGDTVTTAVAALTAYFTRMNVGHIEAGLRTGDKFQPFPEEINRRITGLLADLHFTPTDWSQGNLLREGVSPEQVVVTGNTVIDALFMTAKMRYEVDSGPLADLPWDKRLILVTAHRRENFGLALESICDALREIAARGNDVHIVYPVHLNPNVHGPVYDQLKSVPDITLLPPLDYLPLVHLMKRCTLVLTDSGGIQEEAPSLGKPVLVLREKTERPEGVRAGTVKLVGTDRDQIVLETLRLLDDSEAYGRMAKAVNPYGDGRAAQRIVTALLEYTNR